MDNFSLGLMLMVVGMVTVFVILLVIINLSKLLIKFVNEVAPDDGSQRKQTAPKSQGIDALTNEIILAAVAQVTGGKGHVASVERL